MPQATRFSIPDSVAPDLAAAIPKLPNFDCLSIETLPQFRALIEGTPPELAATSDLSVKWVEFPGLRPAPPVRALLYQPLAAPGPRPALLSLHGGGYVAGAAQREDAALRALAVDAGITVVSLEYRLSPETPFPGPLEDCYAGLGWIHRNAAALNVDPRRVAVRGSSAGGGLAAALTLLARDRHEFAIALQILISPMLDDRTGEHPVAGRLVWTPRANRFGWAAYLNAPPGGADIPAYAAPGRSVDMAELPPAFIAVGSIDLFVDEDLAYARGLIRAGIPTELHVYPGAYHGFPNVTDSSAAKALEHGIRAALRRAFS